MCVCVFLFLQQLPCGEMDLQRNQSSVMHVDPDGAPRVHYWTTCQCTLVALEVLGAKKVWHKERRAVTNDLLIQPAPTSARSHLEGMWRSELQFHYTLSCSRMQRRSSRQHQARSQECLGQIVMRCPEVLRFRVILLQVGFCLLLNQPTNITSSFIESSCSN